FQAWQPLEHPQLGYVEVGGLDPIVGIWNPPPEQLETLATQMSLYWLRVASLLPRLVIEETTVTPLGGGHARVSLAVANHGYLPTQGMNAARERPFNTPVEASIELHDAVLANGEVPRVELGHLAGWGRGLGDVAQMPWFQRSEGSNTRTRADWVVAGSGSVTLRVGNRRLGFREVRLKLPPTG
ncbi:MAG: peptidase M14, partial [Thioalkalivibrio sp.]|nr:peptidase M14 [Thioalkalivibrio sp.]